MSVEGGRLRVFFILYTNKTQYTEHAFIYRYTHKLRSSLSAVSDSLQQWRVRRLGRSIGRRVESADVRGHTLFIGSLFAISIGT